jgi:hypothetical protein
MDDGTEQPVTDLWRWMHEASDITEAEFEALKAKHIEAHKAAAAG